MIGREISHYRIVELLGSGGMSSVWRAEDLLLGRQVALKFPHPDRVRDPANRARFLREARAASVLDHPNIVVLHDVCMSDDEIFLAMQFVEGDSLRRTVERGPLVPERACAIARKVADALAHAHTRGVVHRDVKPENVLLGADGHVKLADFGIALVRGEARLTELGGWVGTVGYVAPEILGGAEGEARSDLFSLGVMLHEMLAGELPFGGGSVHETLHHALHAPARELPLTVPPSLRDVVSSLLEKDPARRPGGASEVADALARVALPAVGRGAEPAPGRAIAVLPFENLTGDPRDDYLCAGIIEDLITEVMQMPDLQPASRTAVAALHGRSLDPRAIGRELGVHTVLEGGIRRAGNRIRITTRLVRTDTGFPLWSDRYDRELVDLLEVQEDIARHISIALRIALAAADPEAAAGRRAHSPRALELRFQALARYRRFERSDMTAAIALYEQALAVEPGFSLARAELAECCVQMVCRSWDKSKAWLERGEREARAAQAQAALLPEAHRALGHVLNHQRRPHEGLRHTHRAVELDPRYFGGLFQLGGTYLVIGDHSRAEIWLRRAIAEDPDSGLAHVNLGIALLRQRRFEDASAALHRAIALASGPTVVTHALAYLAVLGVHRDDAQALAVTREEVRAHRDEDPLARDAILGYIEILLGHAEEARRIVAAAPTESLRDENAILARVRTLCRLAEPGSAIDALRPLASVDIVDMYELLHDPDFESMRRHPRFGELQALQYPLQSNISTV